MPDDLTRMQQGLCRTVTGQRSDTMTMTVAMTSIAIAVFFPVKKTFLKYTYI